MNQQTETRVHTIRRRMGMIGIMVAVCLYGFPQSACKILIKQRLANSGMRWKGEGAGMVLATRALVLTGGRWREFWKKINQYGSPLLLREVYCCGGVEQVSREMERRLRRNEEARFYHWKSCNLLPPLRINQRK